MGADLLGISTSGLLVSQQQISTTGHNIANVNSPGYARQNTTSVSRLPGFSGNGYIGTGVEVESTKRSYNEFLEELIRSSNSQLGKQEEYYNIASQIDNILGDPDAGLSPTLEAFYGALEEANDYPSSVPTRSVLLTNAQSLVDRFDFLHTRLSNLNDQVNDSLVNVTAEVAGSAESLAELNSQLIGQGIRSDAAIPNDVLDQREQLIKNISERIDVNVVYQDNGAANIFIGSGQALVLNTQAFKMELVDSEFTPRDQEIVLSNRNGSFNITNQIKGGELEGLIAAKKEILDSGFNALGRIAAGLTKEMNEQHELGMTLQPNANGGFNLGSNFFNNLDEPQDSYPSNENTSGYVVQYEINDTFNLTTSDYLLEKKDTGFSLKRLSDKLSIEAENIASLNVLLNSTDLSVGFGVPQGFKIDEEVDTLLANEPSRLDEHKFLIQPTHDLARNIRLEIDDVKDVALASPIQVREQTDEFGVGQNTGTASIEFSNFTPPVPPSSTYPNGIAGITRDIDGNLVQREYVEDVTTGGLVESDTRLPFPFYHSNPNVDQFLTIDQYNPVSKEFVVSGPAYDYETGTDSIVSFHVSYDPETQSGTYIALDSPEIDDLPASPFGFINIKITGVPVDGDSFTINNNTTPQDDNRNGLVMAKLQTKKTLENGRADFQRAYSLAVADVGTRTHSSEVDMKAQKTINERAMQNRNSLSGVNLDEEASNLLRFQQAFSASAKVIGVADEVFNTLLQSVR
ncbi:MAG: flagellar hook-associated protein FlgK [Gammaproteobacteria bacterium]|nr:flagellar hook-associated protein FlgK [Gammaproteobacteria bacterium]